MSDKKNVQNLIDAFGEDNVDIIANLIPTIKPCPFCGNTNVKAFSRFDGTHHAISCGDCGATGPRTYESKYMEQFPDTAVQALFAIIEAIQKWNKCARKENNNV